MRQSQPEVARATVGSRYNPKNDMAVDRTPERSFSDLLRTSRAADATTGCTRGMFSFPKWLVAIMWRSVASKDRRGSDRKLATRANVLSSSAYRTWRITPTSSEWLV